MPEKQVMAHAKPRSSITEIVLLHFGVLILSVGIYFFKFPNHFTMGGVAGMSVVFSALFPTLSASWFNMILNVLLLILGFAVFGKSFGLKTTYASLLSSGLILVFQRFWPMARPLTDQPVIELFFAFLLPAAGSAILFNISASSGGTDVIAKIIRMKSDIDIGKALLLTDGIFTLSTFWIFGVETGLFSSCGLLCKGIVVDYLMEGLNRVKFFTIATTHAEEVGDFIRVNLHRGATYFKGNGLFSGEERTVFLCVINRYQAILLRNYVRKVDPHAFITISNTSEIVGRGFRGAP